jgi:hypothetical protein
MAIPTLKVSDIVVYWPTYYDGQAIPGGYVYPVPAIVTRINGTESVNLVIFPDQKAPAFRTEVPYYTDAASQEPNFRLTSDTAPTCTAEKTAAGATDTSAAGVSLLWDNPAGSLGTEISYKKTSDSTYLKVGQGPAATGSFNSTGDAFTFSTVLETGVSYDFLIKNMCGNGLYSAGVVVTLTTTTPS